MTYSTILATLASEWRSRHEGPIPSSSDLLREPWVPAYLRVMFPSLTSPLETDALCACGHAVSEHPLQGGCATCGCLGYDETDTSHLVRQEA